ncbi:MAG: hypothetical protein KF784_14910 [Fimbriimonadaceae bacterium]|nr:hypothetical protein [Fimbriimonadaceae bacterium]
MAFDFQCMKCGHQGFTLSEMRGPSGGMSAYLNIDSQIVTLLSCNACRFTEVYFMRLEHFKQVQGIEGDHYPAGYIEAGGLGPRWECDCGYSNDPTLDICASCNQSRKPPKIVSIDPADQPDPMAEWTCGCGFVNAPDAISCKGCGEVRHPTAREYFDP